MTMMPWLVRNYEVFHKPVFVRDNVGVEFRCGNNPLAEGIWVGMYHPSQNPITVSAVSGKWARPIYSAEQSRLANNGSPSNPERSRIISFRRFIFFWNRHSSARHTPEWMHQHHTKWAARTFHGG